MVRIPYSHMQMGKPGIPSPPGDRDMSTGSSFNQELMAQRAYLMRYARHHLHDAGAAEDAVQETLAAAVRDAATFEARATLRTWLTAILKRKIADHFRMRQRMPLLDDDIDEDAIEESPFGADGGWESMPESWRDPESALRSKEFWRVYEACSARMPRKQAQAYSMREVLGMSTAEICKSLDVTTTNLHVMLFRARLHLRACLDVKWFAGRP